MLWKHFVGRKWLFKQMHAYCNLLATQWPSVRWGFQERCLNEAEVWDINAVFYGIVSDVTKMSFPTEKLLSQNHLARSGRAFSEAKEVWFAWYFNLGFRDFSSNITFQEISLTSHRISSCLGLLCFTGASDRWCFLQSQRFHFSFNPLLQLDLTNVKYSTKWTSGSISLLSGPAELPWFKAYLLYLVLEDCRYHGLIEYE